MMASKRSHATVALPEVASEVEKDEVAAVEESSVVAEVVDSGVKVDIVDEVGVVREVVREDNDEVMSRNLALSVPSRFLLVLYDIVRMWLSNGRWSSSG
jgi:hypothetical protein